MKTHRSHGTRLWWEIGLAIAVVVITAAALIMHALSTPQLTPGSPWIPPLATTSSIAPPPDSLPALAVKIDNVREARPATGLGSASVVYVEPVEGGLTRLVAVYLTAPPAVVGPVRSARRTDIELLAQYGTPVLAYSGASAPVRARDIVLGETLCYLAIAVLQSLLIVGIGAGLFGVRWGDPLAAAALITVWALVGTGTGVLAGTLFRTPEQAGAIGPAIGIAFGMLGGAMWPLEIVPQTMQTIGHITPHAWAVDGWVEILSRGGGILSIGTQLAVLGTLALVLLGIASVRLGRRLTT